MLDNRKRNFAYTDIHKNEEGFTFLSVLMAITLIAMLLPSLSHLLKSAQFSTGYDELSTRQFFVYFRNEMIEANNYKIHSRKDQITLYFAGDREAVFSLYGEDILRRIDGGFEVYLQDVKKLLFTSRPYGVLVTVTTVKGEQYEKEIIFYE